MKPASVRQTVRSLTRICGAAKKLGWVSVDAPAAEALDAVAGRGLERVRCDVAQLFPEASEWHKRIYRWALGAWRDAITAAS